MRIIISEIIDNVVVIGKWFFAKRAICHTGKQRITYKDYCQALINLGDQITKIYQSHHRDTTLK